jgi:hypothetical protein
MGICLSTYPTLLKLWLKVVESIKTRVEGYCIFFTENYSKELSLGAHHDHAIWFAPYLRHLQGHSFFSSGKELENVALAMREKGPLYVPAKTQLLLTQTELTFSIISTALLVSTFQMPSFDPEQKLLSD